MRLAIADPPYLGRANRWYGTGRGSGGGRHAAPPHPQAAEWDHPERHARLVADLAQFDGWAIAAAASSLPVYLAAAPAARVLIWHMTNAAPSGSRVASRYEAVLVHVPPARRGRGSGAPRVSDVLTSSAPRSGFVGSKPPAWTRWVLDALGYDPGADELVDLFPGSGAVGYASAVLW